MVKAFNMIMSQVPINLVKQSDQMMFEAKKNETRLHEALQIARSEESLLGRQRESLQIVLDWWKGREKLGRMLRRFSLYESYLVEWEKLLEEIEALEKRLKAQFAKPNVDLRELKAQIMRALTQLITEINTLVPQIDAARKALNAENELSRRAHAASKNLTKAIGLERKRMVKVLDRIDDLKDNATKTTKQVQESANKLRLLTRQQKQTQGKARQVA